MMMLAPLASLFGQMLASAGISETVALVGVGFVLGQGCAIWALLRIVKSFGAYTEKQTQDHKSWTTALLQAHESNQALNRSNLRILEALRNRTSSEEVA